MKELWKEVGIIVAGYLFFAVALWLGAAFVTFNPDYWIDTQANRAVFLAVWLCFGWPIGAFTILAMQVYRENEK